MIELLLIPAFLAVFLFWYCLPGKDEIDTNPFS